MTKNIKNKNYYVIEFFIHSVVELRSEYYQDRKESITEELKRKNLSEDQIQRKLEELGFDEDSKRL